MGRIGVPQSIEVTKSIWGGLENGLRKESWAAQSLFCGPQIYGPQKIVPTYYDAMR